MIFEIVAVVLILVLGFLCIRFYNQRNHYMSLVNDYKKLRGL